MQQIELKGHSGCRIYLINPNGSNAYVRKISKNFQYNERLKQQCDKQKNYQSKIANTPAILNEGIKNGLYYFDMEYVRGVSVVSLIESCPVDQVGIINGLLTGFIKENISNDFFGKNAATAVEHKLKEIYSSFHLLGNNKNIKKAFEILYNHEWSGIPRSSSHGDLTLENILYSHDRKLYLIDFLDTFYDTWIGDVSKLLQDLLVGWSFRHQFINTDVVSTNIKIRVLLLRKQFITTIDNYINRKRWEDIYSYLLMDLLRIIPYINDNRIFAFVNKSIEAIVKNIERGALYEYLNHTMCWPIYEIHRGKAEVDVNLP